MKFDLARCSEGVPKGYDPAHPSAAQESLSIVDEYDGLIWNERKMRETGKSEGLASCPNHLADAALYNFRHTYQFLATPEPKRMTTGSPEALNAEAEAAWQREMDDINAQKAEQREGLGDSENWELWAIEGR